MNKPDSIKTQGLWTGLLRLILGRSGSDYTSKYTGSDLYWDNALAAQYGPPPAKIPDPARSRDSGTPQ
jgi:hypothetical protein